MDYERSLLNPGLRVYGNWKDITYKFKESVTDLTLGELLHGELFGLFEAMSAIEMMDPKMDAGMVCVRGVKKVISFDQALQDNILKLDGFTDKELIGIIDSTLACLVSWLEGHSLAQTVFINLYLHKPYMIENRILRAFCLAVYKMIEIIKDLVHLGMVYEEEDFQPMQYGYHLNPEISEQRLIGMLREIEEDLDRKTRSKPDHEIHALYGRIKFLRIFLQILISFRKEDNPAISECHRLFGTCLDSLYIVLDTVDVGIKTDDPENEHITGFEPSINQRLLPPTFPRYTKIKSRLEAVTYFIEMIERFKVVSKIQLISSLHQGLDFFIEFSKSSPCILSRSALQLLYPGTNPTHIKDFLRESAKTFICPPALLSKFLLNNAQAKHYVDSFLCHCSKPFINFLQICGHNRARQRDKLARLLEEFAALQDEAERVDAYLHNLSISGPLARPHIACFGTWILYHTLRIMIMYLLTGFELELYSVHEFYYIYWYLYEFLYGWLISALTRADTFLIENDIYSELQNKSKGNKKKPKKKKTRPFNRDILYLQALQNMAGGYYKAVMGFRLDGKITMPHPRFDSEQVRYEHRFEAFQNLITPPPVAYSEFREMTSFERFQQQPVDSCFLYLAGCKHFHQARQLLEGITQDSEIVDLVTICKTNFVVLKLLAGGHKKGSTKPPEFDFTRSKHFPIMKIVN